MEESPIRVLVVDDSLTFRKQVAGVFKKTSDVIVAGEAENGKEAIEKTRRLGPDVILMDIVMPVMSGLAAVEYIMTHMPVPIVIQSHFLSQAEFDKTRDARMAGALAALDKADSERNQSVWEKNLVRTVRAASRMNVAKGRETKAMPAEIPERRVSPKPAARKTEGGDARSEKGVRVLVVDDSLTVRKTVVEVLEKESDILVTGEAKDGYEAIELTKRLDPDVVLMDIVMPVMSGLAAVEYIMAHMPRSIVIHSSFADRGESHRTWDAEMAGALAALDKSVSAKDPEKWERDLVRTVRAASRVRPSGQGKSPDKKKKIPERMTADYNLVAIGVSLGGPAVIARILNALPTGFPLPILLVIHSSVSEKSFSEWLNDNCGLSVKVAMEGESIIRGPGRVFVAPTGRHMTVRRGKVQLVDSMPVNFCRPSIDVLFHSIAEGRDNKPIGVLLTGMGKDGADGLKAIKTNGGFTICQDESTSIVFGMPKAAIAINAADIVLPDNRIAGEILSLVKNKMKRTEN